MLSRGRSVLTRVDVATRIAFGLRLVVPVGILMPFVLGGCTDRVTRGQQLYAKHGCAVCHGSTGRGDGPTARKLTPPPRDFADPRHYIQGSSEEAIAESIATGVETSRSSMPAFSHISAKERRLIAAWVVSLQTRGASSKPEASP
jgi:mono/diheme cytochrome c family protein